MNRIFCQVFGTPCILNFRVAFNRKQLYMIVGCECAPLRWKIFSFPCHAFVGCQKEAGKWSESASTSASQRFRGFQHTNRCRETYCTSVFRLLILHLRLKTWQGPCRFHLAAKDPADRLFAWRQLLKLTHRHFTTKRQLLEHRVFVAVVRFYGEILWFTAGSNCYKNGLDVLDHTLLSQQAC